MILLALYMSFVYVFGNFLIKYAFMYIIISDKDPFEIPWCNTITIIVLSILCIFTATKFEKNSFYIINTIINIVCVWGLYITYGIEIGIYIIIVSVLLIELFKIIGKFNQDKIKIKEENKDELDREEL